MLVCRSIIYRTSRNKNRVISTARPYLQAGVTYSMQTTLPIEEHSYSKHTTELIKNENVVGEPEVVG